VPPLRLIQLIENASTYGGLSLFKNKLNEVTVFAHQLMTVIVFYYNTKLNKMKPVSVRVTFACVHIVAVTMAPNLYLKLIARERHRQAAGMYNMDRVI
jgi:hypothetical protein